MSDKLARAGLIKALATIQANMRSGVTDQTAMARMLSGQQGNYSPLMQRYGTGMHAGGFAGSPLPRDPSTFSTGQQGPDMPTLPTALDPVAPGAQRPFPRIGQYTQGYNLPSAPGEHKLVPFKILRSLADMHDVTRRCIEIVKSDIAGLDWDIVAKEDYLQAKGRSSRSSKGKSTKAASADGKDLRTEIEAIEDWFSYPDRIRGLSFSDWIKMAIEEILVVDALSIYEHPTLGKAGSILGGDLFALEILDGTTIKPLIDQRGTRPMPPNPAYEQYLWGLPRSELVALLPDDYNDPEIQAMQRGFPDSSESTTIELRADQLAYRPFHPRAWTMYGFSNVEQIITTINIALKRQSFHLAYFTEGDVPALLIHVPETWNIDQILRFEQHWHGMLAGDQGWKHRMRAIPGAEKAEPLKPMDSGIHGMDFDEFIARVVCAGFFVDPSDINLDLHSSNAQTTSFAAGDRRYRFRKLVLTWFQEYFDNVIARRFHQPDLCFRFDGLEIEDRKMEMEVDIAFLKGGGMSLNEMRAKRGMEPLDIDQAHKPNVYLTRDVVPVEDIGILSGGQDVLSLQQGMPNAAPGRAGGSVGGSGPKATPVPRAGGGSASGGSATGAKASPSAGKTSTTKVAEASTELSAFERFVGKTRARRFRPDYLPESLVEEVYERVSQGEKVATVFREIRGRQAEASEVVLGDLVEALLDQP